MNYLKIPILEDTSTSKAFRDALHSPPISTGSRLPLKQVEKIIGHGVKHPFYLSQVLVRQFFPVMTGSNLRYLTRKSRTSLPNYKSTSFERLEFLGDGILDFCAHLRAVIMLPLTMARSNYELYLRERT